MDGVTILSSQPGQLSLGIAKLKGNPDLARELEAHLLSIRGITEVKVDPQVGEVEIRYQRETLTSFTSLWALKDVMSHFFPEINAWELAAALSPRL
jgi:hypothetical protein